MIRMMTSRIALLTAFSLAAAAAPAMTQLEAKAQNLLTQYGYDIEATSLTRSQLAALRAVDEDGSNAEIRAAIDSVVSDDDVARMVDAPQLRAQAERLFDEYGIEADASTLSLNKLGALQSVPVESSSDEQARAAIYSILGEAPDAAEIGTMTEPQLQALAQAKLDEYGFEIDASTLELSELVAVVAVDETEDRTYAEITAALESAAGV